MSQQSKSDVPVMGNITPLQERIKELEKERDRWRASYLKLEREYNSIKQPWHGGI